MWKSNSRNVAAEWSSRVGWISVCKRLSHHCECTPRRLMTWLRGCQANWPLFAEVPETLAAMAWGSGSDVLLTRVAHSTSYRARFAFLGTPLSRTRSCRVSKWEFVERERDREGDREGEREGNGHMRTPNTPLVLHLSVCCLLECWFPRYACPCSVMPQRDNSWLRRTPSARLSSGIAAPCSSMQARCPTLCWPPPSSRP